MVTEVTTLTFYINTTSSHARSTDSLILYIKTHTISPDHKATGQDCTSHCLQDKQHIHTPKKKGQKRIFFCQIIQPPCTRPQHCLPTQLQTEEFVRTERRLCLQQYLNLLQVQTQVGGEGSGEASCPFLLMGSLDKHLSNLPCGSIAPLLPVIDTALEKPS